MAIIFEGKSKCPICGEILDEARAYILFPHFISNLKDPLSPFSDGGVHSDCLNTHPLGQKAILYRNKFNTLVLTDLRCIVDGKKLTNRSDAIFMGILTSDENESLHKFNFIVLNKRNVSNWVDRQAFINIATIFLNAGKWENIGSPNRLESFIKIIRLSE